MRKDCGVSTNLASWSSKLKGRLKLPASLAALWQRMLKLPRILRIVLVVVIVGLAILLFKSAPQKDKRSSLATVLRGPMVISVLESGLVQNRERVIVKSEVEGTTTILWLIPEGTHVKAGDPLVDLDPSKLDDDKAAQVILVINAEANFIKARENVAVVESQGQSDVDKADLDLKLGRRDLIMYTEGQYVHDRAGCDANIQLAQEALDRAKDKLDWSKRLAKEGYITQTELDADESAYTKAAIDLELAKGSLALLEEHTKPRTIQLLDSNVTQAASALERITRKASADLMQAKADLKARESEYERQREHLAVIERKISKCHITAPVDGMVVYATTGHASWRGNDEPLAEGQAVREREELIHLPTTTSMVAEIKVHEASLRKIKLGLPVKIAVDAVPGMVFWGKVSKVALLPDAQSMWMNPDLKVYATTIDITGDSDLLRAGMSCRAEVIVDQYQDVLQIPVQSVYRVAGKTVVYLAGEDEPHMQPVTIGMDNGQWVRILGGVSEGQKVLMEPPLGATSIAQETGTIDLPAASQPASQPVKEAQLAGPGSGDDAQAAASQPAEEATAAAGNEIVRKIKIMSLEERKAYFAKMSDSERTSFFKNLTPSQQEQLLRLPDVRDLLTDKTTTADVAKAPVQPAAAKAGASDKQVQQ